MDGVSVFDKEGVYFLEEGVTDFWKRRGIERKKMEVCKRGGGGVSRYEHDFYRNDVERGVLVPVWEGRVREKKGKGRA